MHCVFKKSLRVSGESPRVFGYKIRENRVVFLPSHSLIGWFSYSDGKESVYEEDNGCFFDSGGTDDSPFGLCADLTV